MKRTRALLALAPIAIAASLLTACTSADSSSSSFECAPEGDVSKSLEFDGDLGSEELTLATTTPIESTGLERSVLIDGDGEGIQDGDTIESQMTIFNGATGETLSTENASLQVEEGQLQDWALEVVGCGNVGDRIAAIAPAADVIGEGNGASYGLEDTDSLVMVFDVLSREEGCGEELTARDEAYPEVDLGDGTSEPTITIPRCMEPPTELEIEVLEEGDGPVVEADQNIMTNYVGVDWNGAVRFDGNWTDTGIQFSTAEGALIDGFTQAMVGQKIGSVILVTIPPELGYADGVTRTFVLELVSEAAAE